MMGANFSSYLVHSTKYHLEGTTHLLIGEEIISTSAGQRIPVGEAFIRHFRSSTFHPKRLHRFFSPELFFMTLFGLETEFSKVAFVNKDVSLDKTLSQVACLVSTVIRFPGDGSWAFNKIRLVNKVCR
jgi:hypothetical protein